MAGHSKWQFSFSLAQSNWQASRYGTGMNWSGTVHQGNKSSTGGPIRIGFVPLCDCAPVAMAQELGLFRAQGLQVELSREVGWATIRDKLVMRDIEAAHAPAAMVLGINLGIGSFKVPCVTALVLNLHGNAITLSNRLWQAGVRDAANLRDYARSGRNGAMLTLGVAFSCSSHNFLLQKWLRTVGLDPEREVNVVVVPPPQMAANLKAGNLDGYCVGEPWNSVAVVQRAGWIAATSSDIALRHPEKVLLVRADFAEARDDEHRRLVAALREACEFCEHPANRERVARTLAASEYLNASREAIRRSLSGPFKFNKDRVEPVSGFHIFAGIGVNEPGPDKAAWVRDSLVQSGVLPKSNGLDQHRLASMFRLDLFQSSLATPNPGSGIAA
jgi:ABC-type nitrate/sulfonate/bicarbonate transport system substrate-binding protein